MRELRITDAELQALIAPGLRARLKQAGFRNGTASNDHTGFFFPINLEIAGSCTVGRLEDGTWVFTQVDDAVIAERTELASAAHTDAVMRHIIPAMMVED